MIRLVVLARSLEMGGAERQLVELVKALDKKVFSITVATFYDAGDLRSELAQVDGVNLLSLHKKGRWDLIRFIWNLGRTALRVKPHVMLGNMGVSNELCLLVGRALGAKVVWGLRASNVDYSRYPPISGWIYRLGALLSRFPDLIIVNSHAGKRHNISRGYFGKRMVVIPNGIDTRRFRPDREARLRVREEWGIREGEPLIGLVGRLDPMKDHPTFLKAASLLAPHRADVRFVCVGDGPSAYAEELQSFASHLGLGGRLIWAGTRADMPAVYNALDIACSSSYGEGLPNAVAEAMACGVPCVVTDVGDSARLVDNPAQVVPPRDPHAMALALERLVEMATEQRAALGEQGRRRIVSEYSVQHLASKTEQVLLGILPCTG